MYIHKGDGEEQCLHGLLDYILAFTSISQDVQSFKDVDFAARRGKF